MPTKKIYTNTIAQIGGKVLTALISIVMIKILTNYLDVAGYGLYSKIYNYLSIFAVIADLGLYTITVRELSAHKDDPKMVDKIASNVLTLRTLSGALIIIFSLGIGYFLEGYNSGEAMIGIAIASVFTLLGLINSSLMSYLQSILKTEFSIIANTCGKLLTLGMILTFATLAWWSTHTEKFTLVMLAGLSGNILMTGLTWWYARKWHHVHFGWDFWYIRHILVVSLPYGLALFLNVIFFKVDIILLSILEPRDIADSIIALYALPMKIVEVGMMYGTVFLNSLLPVLTDAFNKDEREKVQKLIKRSFLLLFWGGIIGSILSFFGAEYILRLISSESFVTREIHWFTSIDAFEVVSPIFALYFVSSLATYILIARNQERKMLIINMIIAVINIIGNLILIPMYSFVWAAYATLASQVLLLILTTYVIRDTFIKKV
jgi:O-antigen/teichoic acid export membrane protein